MKVEFYGHVRQYHNIQSEIDRNLQTVLESGQYVMGPMLKQFEGELAAYHGAKFAVGVGNGTDAIWLALMALGVGAGDEVITHPNTFFATAEAIDTAIRKLRNHGSNARNVHSFGFNSRLDDLHAGILSAKLKHIDAWNDLRRKWSARYTAGLKDAKHFTLPTELTGYRHVFHL